MKLKTQWKKRESLTFSFEHQLRRNFSFRVHIRINDVRGKIAQSNFSGICGDNFVDCFSINLILQGFSRAMLNSGNNKVKLNAGLTEIHDLSDA